MLGRNKARCKSSFFTESRLRKSWVMICWSVLPESYSFLQSLWCFDLTTSRFSVKYLNYCNMGTSPHYHSGKEFRIWKYTNVGDPKKSLYIVNRLMYTAPGPCGDQRKLPHIKNLHVQFLKILYGEIDR